MMQFRSLANWTGLACLATALGCGGTTAVQPPVNSTVSVPPGPAKTVPTKTTDEEDKSPGAERDPSKRPPRSEFYPPGELQQVVAALANDDPDQPLTRVWIRKDPSQGASTDQGTTNQGTSADAATSVDVVLSNSLVTDDGLAKLAGIARLRHLNLDDCREITSAGMAHLPALKDLRKLSLNRTAVDDGGLAHLPDLARLTELSLVGDAGVTDAGAASLAQCPELRVLRLKDTRVGDKGLAALKAAPQLREVWLEGTRVTESGIADFEAARPGTQVVHPLRRVKRAQ